MPNDLTIRWMRKSDLSDVLAIEQASFDTAWDEHDFMRVLRCRTTVPLVATYRKPPRVAGFVIYQLHKNYLYILSLAVEPSWRECGVGRKLVDTIKSRLTPDKRAHVELHTRERNLTSQLFWRAMGFTAVAVEPDYYDDTDEDAYWFVHDVRDAATANA